MFYGGFGTNWQRAKAVAVKSVLLSTIGVIITCFLTGLFCHFALNMSWEIIFPQCYAAVVDKIPTMAKKTLVVDIGSWTIDIMPVINKSPDESKCVTVPRGLITCMRSINEQCVRQLNGEVDETEIQNIMRYGRSDIDDEYLAIIKAEKRYSLLRDC